MDLFSLFATLGPILVALVAVWLGYRYQLASLDRDTRRKAYLDASAILRTMAGLIEHAERLNYVTWKATTHTGDPGGPVTKESLAELEGLIVQLLSIAEYAGVHPDWSVLEAQGGPDQVRNFTRLPGQVMRALIWQGEELVYRFNDSIIMALSGTRLTFFHRSRLQIETQNVLSKAFNRLSQILLSFRSPSQPRPVDWVEIDAILSDVETLVLKDLGVFGLQKLNVSHKRDAVPWPREVQLKSDSLES